MEIHEDDIRGVQNILTAWNPLGDQASRISDLNDYRTEAMDILNSIRFGGVIFAREPTAALLRTILEQAFHLDLEESDCEDAGRRIDELLKRRGSVEPADR